MQEFQLQEGQEYIQLNNLLKLLQLAQTGGHAKIIILNKEITVNGLVETQIRKKLFKGDKVKYNDLIINIQ